MNPASALLRSDGGVERDCSSTSSSDERLVQFDIDLLKQREQVDALAACPRRQGACCHVAHDAAKTNRFVLMVAYAA